MRSVLIIYGARVLGAQQWGAFSYAITLIAFLTIFVDIGINTILTKETARNKVTTRDFQSLLSTLFLMKLFLLGIGVFFVLSVAPHISKITEANALFPLFALILIFDTLREFGFSLMRAREIREVEAGLFMLTNLAVVVFGFLFLFIKPTVLFFTYGYVIGTAIGCLATAIAMRRELGYLFSFFKFSQIYPILSAAWPFAASSVLGIFMLNADILILGWFRNATEVGYYSAGNRIVQLFYLLPSILTVSALPALARFAVSDTKKMRILLEQILSFLFLIAIPLGIGGALLGKEIIVLIFGTEYAPASLSFRVLMLTLIIDFCALTLSNAIFSFDQQQKLIINTALGASINVLGDIILIPRFGMNGSAFATLAAQLVSMTYLWHATYRLLPFSILPKLRGVLIATVGMALLVLLLQILHASVVISIIAGGACYLLLLYVQKDATLKEIKHIFYRA